MLSENPYPDTHPIPASPSQNTDPVLNALLPPDIPKIQACAPSFHQIIQFDRHLFRDTPDRSPAPPPAFPHPFSQSPPQSFSPTETRPRNPTNQARTAPPFPILLPFHLKTPLQIPSPTHTFLTLSQLCPPIPTLPPFILRNGDIQKVPPPSISATFECLESPPRPPNRVRFPL
jgi:hypothetical protein